MPSPGTPSHAQLWVVDDDRTIRDLVTRVLQARGYVVVPAATPKPIVAKLHTDFVRMLNQADVRDRLEVQGVEIAASTPAQFEKFIRDEIVRWGKAVKVSGAKPD
mgnify:CR=1 FL=1